jgi:hypothetical protein
LRRGLRGWQRLLPGKSQSSEKIINIFYSLVNFFFNPTNLDVTLNVLVQDCSFSTLVET